MFYRKMLFLIERWIRKQKNNESCTEEVGGMCLRIVDNAFNCFARAFRAATFVNFEATGNSCTTIGIYIVNNLMIKMIRFDLNEYTQREREQHQKHSLNCFLKKKLKNVNIFLIYVWLYNL